MSELSYSIAQIAEQINADIIGDAEFKISSVSSLHQPSSDALVFIEADKAYEKFDSNQVGGIIAPKSITKKSSVNYLLVDNPRLAFAQAAELFDVKTQCRQAGIHISAVVEASSVIAASAIISPNVTIGHHCIIGENTWIKANAVIGDNVEIGANCIIHEGAVIGSDGFGNANEKGQWYKIPQLGGVKIADKVEIGANSTIDCGALDDTIIEEGVRIDNLVQIAHNVHIGAHTAIASQAGVAGSAKIGKHCILAGQVGITGHITICDGAIFTGKAVVTRSIDKPGVYSSNTGLLENSKWHKMVVRLRKLDDLAKIVKKLEKFVFKGEA